MKEYCFGIDVGGTTIKIGFFKNNGEVLDKWEITTRTENFGENILADICEALESKLVKEGISLDEIEGIGIGLPGPVLADGTVLQCVNLGWGTFNVEQKLSEMFHGIKVKAGNDDIVMITLGTGVGGGVIINGKILTGYNGGAGEIGHMHMQDGEEEQCNCGRHGCLEQYASATGVVRLAKRYMAAHSDEKLNEFGENITAKDVFDLAKEGNEGAITITKQMGNYLGKAMSHIAATVNPQAFIIGGGVSKAGSYLIDVVKDTYRETCFSACGDAAVHLAELGNDAGMFGSAALIIK